MYNKPALTRHGSVVVRTLGNASSGTLEHLSGFVVEDATSGNPSESSSTNIRP
jgi:hypothetical protein